MTCLRCGAASERIWCPSCVSGACCSKGQPCVHTRPAKRGVWFALAAIALAACSPAPQQVAAPDKARAKAEAKRQVAEAEAFALDAQRQIDAANAAAAEAERVIAEQRARAAAEAEAAQRQAAARASRSRTTLRPAAPRPAPAPATGDVWGRLAQCESGGNPRAVGGGGRYFGLYQFSLSTWRSVGGSGNPADASPAEQTSRAQALQRRSGWGQWPTCARKLGLI